MKTVSRLAIAPVKGMALRHPDEIRLERHGVANNRRFHVIDDDGRRYGQIRNGTLVRVVPEYDAELVHDGKVVGRVTSAARRADGSVVALAYVRTEVPPDAQLVLAHAAA